VIVVSSTETAGAVEVHVIDQGPGIPDKYKQAIFERFEQLESETKDKRGAGLGLAICKAIVDQHGGSIGVDSEDGNGSSFWFRIPKR
jgi:signal transduction histidine kinase